MRTMRIAGLVLLAALVGCDMDLNDPNNPTELAAVGTTSGIAQIAVGMQALYGNVLDEPVYVVGLVTDEIGAGAATFDSYQRADRGEEITGDDGPSTGPWATSYDVIRVANVLIDNTENVGFGPGMTSSILALAKLYKAMAFGNLYQIYERAPLNVGPTIEDPAFATRAELEAEVIRLLEEARQHVTSNPPPAEFTSSVLMPGFDLENTINAMLARYNLMAENYEAALAAAQRVDLTVLSEYPFSSSDSNPLWNMWYASGNAYQMRAEDEFRNEAEVGDERIDYWTEEADIEGAAGPLDEIIRYDEATESFPFYLPDEMRLIMAEVYARRGDIALAREQVNEVRTQCSSAIDEPVACLPPLTLLQATTEEAMLEEILRQRRYELYLQAVRWSDLRRFGQPVKYEFMPVPTSECERNQSTPQELCQPVG